MQSFVQPSADVMEEDRSVCLTYGGWTNRSMYEATSWFVRYSLRERPDVEDISKDAVELQPTEMIASKKRKVRDDKRLDVGSLLGSFL